MNVNAEIIAIVSRPYICVFVCVCATFQLQGRHISLSHWTSCNITILCLCISPLHTPGPTWPAARYAGLVTVCGLSRDVNCSVRLIDTISQCRVRVKRGMRNVTGKLWNIAAIDGARFHLPPNTLVISGTGYKGSNDPTNSVKALNEENCC